MKYADDGYKLFNCEVLIHILCFDCRFLHVGVNSFFTSSYEDVHLKPKSSNKSELIFTSSYEAVYLKAESSNKNTEYGCPECRSSLTLA